MTHRSSSSSSSAANALGGRTARACDSCIRRRARWYCAADEAFLCQACDFSVHSANPLARRHHRLRLNTISSSALNQDVSPPPAWHRGFTRKPRTPRGKLGGPAHRSGPLVPDNNTTEPEEEEKEEEDLLYRVPIFNPDLAELYSPAAEPPSPAALQPPVTSASAAADDIPVGFNFHPTDVEHAEFSADVESLLGQGLDVEEQYLCMDRLGLAGDVGYCKLDDVKMETTGSRGDVEMELSGEALDIDFDYRVPEEETQEKKRFTLRLDYEAVISAWSGSGCSPWTGGQRPQLDHWPDYLGMWGGGEVMPGMYGREAGNVATAMGDGDREARVMRYREKRRTRLFSKKIRYEVRKLNAEKRPRIKGRFVKRTSCFSPAVGSSSFSY